MYRTYSWWIKIIRLLWKQYVFVGFGRAVDYVRGFGHSTFHNSVISLWGTFSLYDTDSVQTTVFWYRIVCSNCLRIYTHSDFVVAHKNVPKSLYVERMRCQVIETWQYVLHFSWITREIITTALLGSMRKHRVCEQIYCTGN